jgi:hypothetical protein
MSKPSQIVHVRRSVGNTAPRTKLEIFTEVVHELGKEADVKTVARRVRSKHPEMEFSDSTINQYTTKARKELGFTRPRPAGPRLAAEPLTVEGYMRILREFEVDPEISFGCLVQRVQDGATLADLPEIGIMLEAVYRMLFPFVAHQVLDIPDHELPDDDEEGEGN